jgi:ectoine hydroxylase-related dioxygenase (phytanoyl-CoA dioxygenase family)
MEAQFAEQYAHLPPAERVSAYNQSMYVGWLTKDLPIPAERLDRRWLIADYEAGDMVVHSPYMVHAATVNADPEGRLRLSTDIRY